MKFCNKCSSILRPVTNTGELNFHCVCEETYPAEPIDTLRFEEYIESSESNEKYKVFIENSSHDLAGLKVDKTCKSCGIPFLTMIYIGVDETPLYTCLCGAKFSNEQL